jgi:hypothetical protein
MHGQRYPKTVTEKVICAKSIIQAVVAAHDAGSLEGENYEMSFPLNLAAELLEQATLQGDEEEMARRKQEARS